MGNQPFIINMLYDLCMYDRHDKCDKSRAWNLSAVNSSQSAHSAPPKSRLTTQSIRRKITKLAQAERGQTCPLNDSLCQRMQKISIFVWPTLTKLESLNNGVRPYSEANLAQKADGYLAIRKNKTKLRVRPILNLI